jgi:polyphenol oxidase
VSTSVTLTPARRAGLDVLEVSVATSWGVDAFITTRAGGVSHAPYDTLNLGTHVGDDPEAVAENRRRVARAAGVDGARLVTARQVHSAHALEIDGPLEPGVEADALVSDAADLALAVLVADCVPILVVDPAGPRVGVVHAGWRGLASGVIAATLALFADASRLRAFVGPSISRARYQVGPEVASHFADIDGALEPDEGDRSRLDLRAVAHHLLVTGGVEGAHVLVGDEVTDDVTTFFSDRAQRPCGRFALVARVAVA